MTGSTAPDPAPEHVRRRLALVLDVDDDVAALRLARELRPWFGVAKVGLELFAATGPLIVGRLVDAGYEVFCDLKFHDIPTQVGRASRVLGALGVRYATLHARGGLPMLRAGVEGLREGAAAAELAEPVALAVTVLTSDAGAPAHVVPDRVKAALEAGAGGVVCAADDVHDVRQIAPRLEIVVPGIRPAGSAQHDQARAATPEVAVAAGADLLVVGRAVTGAPDRPAAAAALAGTVARALEARG